MANSTTKKKTEEVSEKVVENTKEESTETKTEKKRYTPTEVDPSQTVIVLNGFQGKLTYISPRTREKYKWEEFGGEQEIEIRELRNAKGSAKEFFVNNWFMFDEEYAWVIDYLGVKQYYKNSIRLDEFDDIFELPADEVESRVSVLSKGQKQSLGYRARQLVAEDKIESLKVIAALERALGIKLIEK